MTQPVDSREHPADWDDARLDAAYRGAFDRRPPAELLGRVLAQARPAPHRRPLFDVLRPVGAVAAVVVILVAGIALAARPGDRGQLASGSPAGSAGASPVATTPIASVLSPYVYGGWPSQVPFAAGGQVLPVLDVAQAMEARNGLSTTELAVGGWYRSYPVPCPLWLGPPNLLDSCGLDHTWLAAEGDLLATAEEPAFSALHPAVHPVTDWISATSDVPHAVVFIGHFDDGRASTCRPERHQICLDRFVVDDVAWTDEPLAAGFPAESATLRIESVSDAIVVRESGAATELAIGGWYEPALTKRFCQLELATQVPLLEVDCNLDHEWLMSEPEALYSVADGEVSFHDPSGSAINVVFGRLSPPDAPALPTSGTSRPVAVVLIGHFNDARAAFCRLETAAACRRRFVVDAVAWRAGHDQPLGAVVDLRSSGEPALTAPQRAASEAFVGSHDGVLHVVIAPRDLMGLVEPALAQPTGGLPNDPVSWIATVLERVPLTDQPVVRTYLVDASGDLWIDAGPSFGRFEAPTPS